MEETEEERRRRIWRENYGDDMVPEKIIDTKIGEDGKQYYKVKWADTRVECGKNFLQAELLIRKYWDPVEKKLKLPNHNLDEGKSSDEECVEEGIAKELPLTSNKDLCTTSREVASPEDHTRELSDVSSSKENQNTNKESEQSDTRTVDAKNAPLKRKHPIDDETTVETNENEQSNKKKK